MSSYHNQAIAYRPEIDGLRAVAVLPVILFHAGFELFSGGYVGVDVFFVISGYLITSIILREKEQGKFSIVRFYERRARRILPALFFVIACCIPFAWMLMLPDELKRFGQSLVAVATFSSNIYFWRTTDYFAPAAEEQPLLHTWSLAVEEQYYLFFPLFLMLFWRFGKSKVFWLTLMAAALSLLLAEWAWRNQPVANFYLLPTRAWELLAGSLVAFIPKELAEKAKTDWTAKVFSVAGLLMILYSILFFDGQTPFPSIYTVVPVLGSVLLIIYTNRLGVVGNLLASKPIVGIGLISYSAYLWHQPIFAFLRLNSLDHPSQLQFALGALASLALAYLTWRFVEQPTRRIKVNQTAVLRLASLGLVVTLAIGLTNHAGDGFESRFVLLDEAVKDTFERAEANCFDKPANSDVPVLCSIKLDTPTTSADYLVLGDSHMYSLLPAFRSLENKGSIDQKGAYVGYSGCPPFSQIHALRQDQALKNCHHLNEEVFRLSKKMGVKRVFLVARWTYYTDGGYSEDNFSHIGHAPDTPATRENSRDAFQFGLSSTLTRWEEVGVQVIIVTQVPQQKYEPKKIYFEAAIKQDSAVISSLSVANEEHKKLQEWVNGLFVKYETSKSVRLVRPDSLMCSLYRCKVGETSESYYYDDDHVSIIGAQRLAPLLKEVIH